MLVRIEHGNAQTKGCGCCAENFDINCEDNRHELIDNLRDNLIVTKELSNELSVMLGLLMSDVFTLEELESFVDYKKHSL